MTKILKKKVNNIIDHKNLIVELYKIKFEKIKPLSDALRDLQINKIYGPQNTYAQGFSDGYDNAIDAFVTFMIDYEIKLK